MTAPVTPPTGTREHPGARGPRAPLDAAAFRARFPVLREQVHLAGCSLGPRSADLDAALTCMLADMAAHGAPWQRFEERIAEARRLFAAFVGAREDQIAIVPDASTGAFQVASTMDWGARRRIVSTMAEFPSISHVWLAQRPEAEVGHVAADAGVDEYAASIDRTTGLVSVPLVDYRAGRRLPVEDIVAVARAAGARVFVDAYQAGSCGPVDVSTLDCDFLVMGTMKYLLGLPGIAFLYVRDPAGAARDPRLTGWFGRRDPFAFDPTTLDFADGADRYRVGTASVPAAYAACAGLRLLSETDPEQVRDHVHDLAELAADRLRAHGEDVEILPRPSRGAHLGLRAHDPAKLGLALEERGISVAPRGEVVRIALHYYNNADDVDALCSALAELRDSASPSPARTTRR